MEYQIPNKSISEEHVKIEFDYTDRLKQWDKFSSIRSRPRRIIDNTVTHTALYPIQRKPICYHPIVQSLGETVINRILLQGAYKFMSDIAFVEIKMINHTAEKIYDGSFSYIFPDALRLDMLSIIIDEAYHAYVAIDFINQLQAITGVKPIKATHNIELQVSLNKFKKLFQPRQADIFEIIAICIGENTLTKELFNMTREKNINPFFHQVMADHMIDEGRHSSIFRQVLRELWSNISEEDRCIIGAQMPAFVFDYLKPDLHIEFDTILLSQQDLSTEDINTIIQDTYVPYTTDYLKKSNPIFKNLLAVLETTQVLEHGFTQDKFKEYGLI